jgi:hypothetical protein
MRTELYAATQKCGFQTSPILKRGNARPLQPVVPLSTIANKFSVLGDRGRPHLIPAGRPRVFSREDNFIFGLSHTQAEQYRLSANYG